MTQLASPMCAQVREQCGRRLGQKIAYQADSTDWYVGFINYVAPNGTVSLMAFPPGGIINASMVPYDNIGNLVPSWRYLDIGT